MHLINTLTTPAGESLVNIPADPDTLAELGFDQAAIDLFMQQALADYRRAERNTRLAQLDALVMNPLRWAEFEDAQKTALAAYRQALLDVPQQAGFPVKIDWPDFPALASASERHAT